MKFKVWRVLGFMLMIILNLLTVHVVCAVRIAGTITVGAMPRSVAYDSGKGEIFVPNLARANVQDEELPNHQCRMD